MPYEPFKPDRIKPMDLLKNLKREYVDANQWLPIDDSKEGLVVLCLDPERVRSSRIASNVFPKARIVYKVTTLKDFRDTVNQFYGQEAVDMGDIDDLLSGLDEGTVDAEATSDDVSAAADNELVKLVNKIIIDAYNQGASDIHIEPYPGKAQDRGALPQGRLARGLTSKFPPATATPSWRASRSCAIWTSPRRRKPQDGKIKFKKFGPLDIELRVATIPTAGGVEDIVMRILAAGEPIPLDKLGLTDRNFRNVKKTIEKPYGLFFVCGPTGSGKTTTLHSVLGYLNTPDTKIWTAEDPVEITQKGLRQVQVNKKAGLDFAVVMKAFLRADPDIIMVGEMRDKETTSTGHRGLAYRPPGVRHPAHQLARRSRSSACSTWAWTRSISPTPCSACWRSAWPSVCVPSASSLTIPTPTEIKSLLNEFCEELMNTEPFKKDAKGAMEAVYKDWVKNYGNEKGQLTMYKPVGCDACGGTGYQGAPRPARAADRLPTA